MYFVVLCVVFYSKTCECSWYIKINSARHTYLHHYIGIIVTSPVYATILERSFYLSKSPNPSKWARHFLTTTIPVYYKMEVCVFNCMGVIKNR